MHQVFPRLSDTPGTIRTPAPEIGQDNAALLSELGDDTAAQGKLNERRVL
jgi:crotonobetainyl-CoA:carnitine CoA-transferase CaiB-like acyl-CoA transferase